MAEETTIRMKCPTCGAVGRGKASYLNRDIRCPKCGNTGRFVRVSSHDGGFSEVRREGVGKDKKPFVSVSERSTKRPQSESQPAAEARSAPPPTSRCPYCGEEILQEARKCKHCGEFLGDGGGQRKNQVMTNVKQGALIGAVVCFAVGILLMIASLWSFFLYGPLFLATFILSIIAMSQRRVAGGLAMLLLSIVIPPILFIGLSATRVSKALEDMQQSITSEPDSDFATDREEKAVPPLVVGQAGDIVVPEKEAVLNPNRAVQEKADYIKLVQLYGLKAKYYMSVLDERVPGVEFKLRNAGQRTLSKVKVTVYFKDAGGNIIAEKDYYPVLLSEFSIGAGKPLKPGYIWQIERGKFYQAKDVPTEWQEGNVQARVTEVDFATPKGVKMEGLDSPEKQAYLAQLDLYDFQSRYHTTVLDERMPGVEFKLKNRGNRSLKSVEVTVFFKNANGRIISEEDYHAVLASDSPFSSGKPLKPGYIWQMERGKFYQAPRVPDEWQEGSAEARITDLEFAD